MKPRIEFDTSAIQAFVSEAQRKSKNIKPLLNKIGADMSAKTDLNFNREREPDGTPWKLLKESTLRRRASGKGRGTMAAKSGRKGKILQNRGILKSSMTEVQGDNWVAYGTNDIRSKTHQFGYKKRNIPARQFVGMSQRQLKQYRSMIVNYFKP